MAETQHGLNWLNHLAAADAEKVLLACCHSLTWAREIVERRPYVSIVALHETANKVWWGLAGAEKELAYGAHPRISTRDGLDAVTRSEQANILEANPRTLAEIASGNHLYEQRFRRIFLIRASGRTAAEILGELRRRLGNDPDRERVEVATEQAAITWLRLQELLDAGGVLTQNA